MFDYLADVWNSRKLIYTFASRDLKIQYAQTYLGILWSVIQPLTALVIFTFFFSRIIRVHLDVPYPVFAFTGIMGWFFFTHLVAQAGTVLMSNQFLIKKMHFPRLVLLISKVLVGLVEFGIAFSILMVILIVSGTPISAKIFLVPLVLLANIIAGLSISIWLSAFTIRFRDLHHIIPYLIGFGIWLTPVFYPKAMLPPSAQWIYYVHPVANVLALYRWIFIGMPINIGQICCSFSIALVMFITGLFVFVRNEKIIADFI
jgi:lipopolysaccharide transport system permease protein